MNHLLEYAHYGEALGNAAAVIRSNAASAGLGAVVWTCDGWTVRDLVAHVGGGYRWAAAQVRGEEVPAGDRLAEQARASADLLDWFDDGLIDVLNALGNAPEDLDVPFFLPNAPAPRLAWARRQAHESTIHAIDAMAARLGRRPAAGELWFSEALAVDGVDEFLTGWWVRLATTGLPPVGVVTDTGPAWILGPGAGEVRVGSAEEARRAPARFTGTASDLYAGLWNRGEVTASDPAVLAAWREQVRV
ncbi:MAG: maleylpyruvate isomerase family mycothiol-dependent enzyme [Propioniciclava sp.]